MKPIRRQYFSYNYVNKINTAAARKKNLTKISWVSTSNCYSFLCLLQYNGTYDGLYRVYTGKEDISKTAIIESYKNKRYNNIVYMKKNNNMFKVCILRAGSLRAIIKWKVVNNSRKARSSPRLSKTTSLFQLFVILL